MLYPSTCPDSKPLGPLLDNIDNPIEEPSGGVPASSDGRHQTHQASPPPGDPDWAQLVAQIRAGDARGVEELYRLFCRGVRFYLCRQLGLQDLDDKVHDTFLIVLQAIQKGDLREPERLMGFIRTVVRRRVATHIDQNVRRRQEEDVVLGFALPDSAIDPEHQVILQQKAQLMEKILQSLSRRDREILTRFYLHEQTSEQICNEMHLTETQFRLIKSRAKSRFGELGRKNLKKPAFLPRVLASVLAR